MNEATSVNVSNLPLAGCCVVITRPRSQSAGLSESLSELGADVVAFPTIRISDPPSFGELDSAIRKLAEGGYEWVAFLSTNSVDKVMDRLRAAGYDPGVATRARIMAVGRATAEALAAHGVSADLPPDASTAAGVAAALGRGTGTIFVPRVAGAPQQAMDALRSQGWSVEEVVAYETHIGGSAAVAETIRNRGFNIVTFTSGSTVRGFVACLSAVEAGLAPHDPSGRKVACIGPTTADTARKLGFRVDAVATEPSTPGLVRAVLDLR
jgi:uroporphyrinogen-III synthase